MHKSALIMSPPARTINKTPLNYSTSLITNQGTVERGKIHSARAMKENLVTYKPNNCTIMNYFLELIVCQELARQDIWPHCKDLLCTTR